MCIRVEDSEKYLRYTGLINLFSVLPCKVIIVDIYKGILILSLIYSSSLGISLTQRSQPIVNSDTFDSDWLSKHSSFTPKCDRKPTKRPSISHYKCSAKYYFKSDTL